MKIFTLVLFFTLNVQAQKLPSLKAGDPLPGNLFVELGKLVNPSVVNIKTQYLPKMRSRLYRDPFMDMLEQMYGAQQIPRGKPQAQTSLGTGFIIREDGLIVTNNHVIAGADIVNVQLNENEEKLYEATIIGSDDRTDIALIKIKAPGKLSAVQLGSSKDLEVGEWVAAFGNPFGQGHTLTKGIISAKGRAISEVNKIPLLQTDAPINPGNSGGPLVNSKGLVIGVNSAIDARAQGIGFAIPIDEVKQILPMLEKDGKVRKGFLGVELADLDPQSAQYLGMSEPEGAVIVNVANKSPAQKSGILPYDIVLEFNGKKIRNTNELRDAVSDAPVNTPVKAIVFRDGKKKTLNVTVNERQEKKVVMAKEPKNYFGQKAPFDLGFLVADSTPEVRKQFGIEAPDKKPVVVNVVAGSTASQSDMQVGDVILDVNRKEVSSAQDVLKQIKKGTNTMRVGRGEATVILMINTP